MTPPRLTKSWAPVETYTRWSWMSHIRNMPKNQNDDLKGSFLQTASQNLTTLALDTAILAAGPACTRGGAIVSVRGSMSVRALTAGDGPWLVGIATGDLSLAEIEAYLELNGPLSPTLRAESEIASRGRYLRTLGLMRPFGDGSTAGIFFDNKSISGLKFPESGESTVSWNLWLYNLDIAMTTGAQWKSLLQWFVRWNPSG